jgi:hypothetical protein
MNEEFRNAETFRRLLKVLDAQRRVLVESRCDEELVRGYSALLKYLVSLPKKEAMQIFCPTRKAHGDGRRLQLSQLSSVINMSLDDVENYVKDASAPRKLLEQIAVERFNFPRGSLRSLQNLVILREKIMTMVRNERAHRTISSLAERTGR